MNLKKIKNSDAKTIAYTYDKRNTPCIVYLHGLCSSRQSEKGKRLARFCEENGYSFLAVDYTGHGESEGLPSDFRIKRCLDDVIQVLETEQPQEDLYFVGSSMGAWVAFLAAEKLKDRIKGIIACAAGVDFLPMVWKHFFTDDIRNELQNGKVLGPSEETYGYCFSYEMFTQAEPYLLLNRKIHYTGPVILVHGDKDTVIPYQNSLKIKDTLESKQVCVQIIKGEGHSLSGFPLERTLKFFIKQEK